MPENIDQMVYLKDYKVPCYLIETTDLCFEVENNYTLVTSILALRKNPLSDDISNMLVLDGEALELQSLTLDDTLLTEDKYQVTGNNLKIFGVPHSFYLTIVTKLYPRENTTLNGLYQSNQLLCTQCEAQGFRRITYYIDRPDVLAIFTTEIKAKNLPVLLSNGNLISESILDDGRKRVKWHDPYKKPSYLFALVAGDLVCVEDTFTTMSNKQVKLQMYVESCNKNKCQFALESLKKAMKWDEEEYAREYDLELYMIVAVSDFNMGAMENKGLNIFNTRYVVVDPDMATDMDYHLVEAVIGHEYFHNWTGNRITCRDWFQLSLKEGLTVFREQEFSAAMGSQAVNRIMDVERLRRMQFPEDAGPLAHSVQPQSYLEINNFYTMTVYEKGAEIIRMLKVLLGKDKFSNAMEYYFSSYDGMAITIEDFFMAMEKGSGMDLHVFKRWYYQVGTPRINITCHYDVKEKVFRLDVEQLTQPLVFPMTISLLRSNGEKCYLNNSTNEVESVITIAESKQTLFFDKIDEEPVASLFRNFSAPVSFTYTHSSEELRTLILYDDDGFNRWQAMQQYMKNIFIELIQNYKNSIALNGPDELVTIFREILQGIETDKLLVSKLLTLPKEMDVSEYLVEDDVEAVHFCHNFISDYLASELQDVFQVCYEMEVLKGDYQFNHGDWGKRALRNCCLWYLMRLQTDFYLKQSITHFTSANNMSDRIAAIFALNNIDCNERSYLLDVFYKTWQDNPLVLDKWFAFQGSSTISGTASRVQNLAEMPEFVLTNPNRVRSLFMAFSRNRIHFHGISGTGYKLLSHFILKLDKINPQVAARLVEPFSHWKRFDKLRQEKMCMELKNILNEDILSKDVYEIASKSLQND